jgi:hypothetical protein
MRQGRAAGRWLVLRSNEHLQNVRSYVDSHEVPSTTAGRHNSFVRRRNVNDDSPFSRATVWKSRVTPRPAHGRGRRIVLRPLDGIQILDANIPVRFTHLKPPPSFAIAAIFGPAHAQWADSCGSFGRIKSARSGLSWRAPVAASGRGCRDRHIYQTHSQYLSAVM